MSVASHLRIHLADYDRRVRTFIPGYEAMLNAAAAACGTALERVRRPVIVDLGVGTGALASRCLEAVPSALLVGVDSDPEVLGAAMKRLSAPDRAVTLVRGDFTRVKLPAANAMVATLSLHHIPTAARKRAFYTRCAKALGRGGVLVSGDCHPSSVPALAARQEDGWVSHLRESYSAAATRRFLQSWAAEDTYMTLEDELSILQSAGFAVDVVWRRSGFAVIAGVRV
jgi:ubiquinone/menaquinone biosynthesis C-methylase UbiE